MIINVHELTKESFTERLVSLFPKTKVEYFVESVEIEGSDKLTDMIEKFYPEMADVSLFQNLSYTNLLGHRAKHETFFEKLSVKLIFYVGESQIKFHVTETTKKLYIIDHKLLNLKIELINGVIKNSEHEIITCSQEDLLDLFALSFYGDNIAKWYKSIGKRKPKVFRQSDVELLLSKKSDVIDYLMVQEMIMA
jgi:hypothetical protein